MSGLCGWAGNVLQIDLTDRGIAKIPTTDYEPEKFIGGVGLNTKIFWDLGCPEVAAFDPANPLLISVGPLTGLPGPFSRAEVCSIAPQSYPRELFTYSGFGGKWPAELKYAGYDGLVVLGRADRPVYILIQDEAVEIRDAGDLWGLDMFETQRVMMGDEPGASVLCIGPAGENLSRNAVIANETGSTAGQGGFGAVMGSKNLKAISVRGTGSVRIAKPDEFLGLIAGRKAKGQWLTGASQVWARKPLCGGQVETEMVGKYRKKFAGCYGCPYQCIGFYDVPGVGQGLAMCASWWLGFFVQDGRTAWEGTLVAQKLGINHYELLGLMWFLSQLFMEGLLAEEEWAEAGLPPISEIVGGTDAGRKALAVLMDGIAEGTSPFSAGMARALSRLVDRVGREDAVRRVYELLFPAHGYTSHFYGWLPLALHAAVDSRDPGNSTDAYLSFAGCGADAFVKDPADVAAAAAAIAEHFGVPGGRSTYAHPSGGEVEAVYEGIERQTVWTQCNQSLKNSLPMCNFFCLPDQLFDPPEMDIRIFESRVFSAVTGVDMDVEELWRAGERIWNLRRAVMVKREGRTREDDTFHDAIFDTVWMDMHPVTEELLPTQIDRDRFEALKDRYYELCGWDRERGWPTRAKLEELDMQDVADELEAVDDRGD
ncbi:MAG: hypothetical protein ISS49_04275 [Anaerolineae bacterium]|nr:hypothetical protein [Anaerolineae bacterium]